MLSYILPMDGRLLAGTYPQWLHWLEQTPSTNTWALTHADQLAHGDVVFTPQQTAGRGQADRVWQSPPGVLTASFVVDGIDPVHWPKLSLASALAVIYAIEDLLPTYTNALRLKWPNDVWYDQRKLAGILCEGVGQRVIVGIGCNRQVDLALLNGVGNPISLHYIQASVPSELALLERLRHYLLEVSGLLNCGGWDKLLPALRQRDGLGDRALHIQERDHAWAGIARGIDDQGRILIENEQGQIRALTGGRISLAGAETIS